MPPAAPALSIILPIIDRAETLRVAIEDVLGQDFDDFEVLIAGSGATGEVRDICRAASSRDHRIQFLDLPASRTGTAQARAGALDQALSDIVLIRQDDDLWAPGHVSTMLGLLEHSDLATTRTLVAAPSGRLAAWPAVFHQPAYRSTYSGGGQRRFSRRITRFASPHIDARIATGADKKPAAPFDISSTGLSGRRPCDTAILTWPRPCH